MASPAHESRVISMVAQQINDVVRNDGELTALATQVTTMGFRMRCLGLDKQEREYIEVGDHLYKLGCDLQAIAIIRMKKS